MGLPGSGKSTLAAALREKLESVDIVVERFNGDDIRTAFDDWDFSEQGRLRQAVRISSYMHGSRAGIVIADFVAPSRASQVISHPDLVVWMDTIKESRYADTNDIFQPPVRYHFRVREQNAELYSQIIFDYLIGVSNEQ